MRKIFILTFFAVQLIPFSARPQKSKISFHSINTFELICGESKSASGFQTVNGIQLSNWYTGIGIGVDNYRYKTAPLFLDLRKSFDRSKRAFLYGDLGCDFPMKKTGRKQTPNNSNNHFTGGIYTDLGIEYRFPIVKKTSFLISMGYSYKKLKNKIGAGTSCPFVGPCSENYTTNEFSFGRIIFKSGIVF